MNAENTPPRVSSGLHSVDQSLDPATRAQFLGAEGSKPAMQYAKQRSFDLLELQPGAHVLDVGCGTGEDVATLAAMVGPDGLAVGIDTDPHMVELAQQRVAGTGLPAQFRVADIYALEDPDASYDGVRADRTFLHLAHPDRALRQMARILRSNGRVAVQDRDIETRTIDAPDRALTRRIVNFWCDSFLGGWNGRQLQRLFREAGLVDVTIEAVTVIDTDYAPFNAQYDLSRIVARAQEAGVVTPQEGAGWLAGIEAQASQGNFFSSVTSFIVGGRKP